jgi:hypothetical protein
LIILIYQIFLVFDTFSSLSCQSFPVISVDVPAMFDYRGTKSRTLHRATWQLCTKIEAPQAAHREEQKGIWG